jgi:hypothetical protein
MTTLPLEETPVVNPDSISMFPPLKLAALPPLKVIFPPPIKSLTWLASFPTASSAIDAPPEICTLPPRPLNSFIPAPAMRSMEPPTPRTEDVDPEDIRTAPPAFFSPKPTTSSISPPEPRLPDKALPVSKRIFPELPADAVPVAKEMLPEGL